MSENPSSSTPERRLIESGSHVSGATADAFKLPANTAFRLERPAAELARLFTNYHVMDSVEAERASVVDWMLPSWAAIRIYLGDNPLVVTLGNRTYDPVPNAALYGVTSRAMRVATGGGVSVGIGLSPVGWARLFHQRADAYRDRITPLDALMQPDRVAALEAALRASDGGAEVKPVLDTFFADMSGEANPDEPLIERITALIRQDVLRDVDELADELGIDTDRLRRLTNRYFGFPPKTLMLRTRFLRSFIRMKSARDRADYSLVAPIYHDHSHFLRDARRFLGMTPKQFMAMNTSYLDASIRAAATVRRTAEAAEGTVT